MIGVEAELVYRFTSTLVARQQPYEDEEVLEAIGSVHAAIEIVDTRFAVWNSVERLAQVADQMNHGALITGSGRSDWREIDPVNEPVSLSIDGKPAFETVGGNSAGDPLRMLVWLANTGARSLGGIKAGDLITTGPALERSSSRGRAGSRRSSRPLGGLCWRSFEYFKYWHAWV